MDDNTLQLYLAIVASLVTVVIKILDFWFAKRRRDALKSRRHKTDPPASGDVRG